MRTRTEIELSIANLLALSPLMHLAVAGRKLKLQEERDNYSGPAASHLKTKTALGFEDVSWIMVFFKAFHPAFRQGHDEDAVRVFHSTKCLRNKKRSGGAAPDPLDPLDWTGLNTDGHCPGGVQLAPNCHECACKEAGTESSGSSMIQPHVGYWALDSQSQTLAIVLFLWKPYKVTQIVIYTW